MYKYNWQVGISKDVCLEKGLIQEYSISPIPSGLFIDDLTERKARKKSSCFYIRRM
jgi:hypothetical protein